MELILKEKEILRKLAQQYMALALSDTQIATQKLWASLNNGRMQRPMVIIDQLPWHEMDVDGFLQCEVQHPYWRAVELNLRKFIYQHTYMPVDMVMPPYIMIPYVLTNPQYRRYGLNLTENILQTDVKNNVVSHQFINQFESMQDVEKIQFTKVELDATADALVVEQAKDIFAGVAPIQRVGITIHMGIWDIIAEWMSVEEIYFALIDAPELLHAIMQRATDVTESWIDMANEQKLFDTASSITHCSSTLTAPFTQDILEGTAKNAWSFAMAQLFTSVSPEITAEFEVPYMTRLFKKMGNVYYGCCERLDDRLDVICKMPNLRKISCSPWNNKENFAEKLPKEIIMSAKPNPALVGTGPSFDKDVFRADIAQTINVAKRHNKGLELILKDNSSVQSQPQRIWQAAKIMMEEVQKF